MPNGAKNWCWTLNNWTEDDVSKLIAIGTERVGVSYLCYGKETGEEGTPHLQGFISFDRRRSLSYVRNFVNDRAHYEIARGTPAENRAYCSKDGEFSEFGACPEGRGRRTDLEGCIIDLKAGRSKREILESHPTVFAKYPRFVSEVSLLYGKKRDWKPEVYVYWGETGTGKTKRAHEEAQGDLYVHPGGSWFDGYDGQEAVLFDDYGGSEFKLTYLLKLLDRYPMRVPVKGGFVSFVPRKIWITSNYSPKEWYSNAKDEHVKALFRRFERVIRFRRLASVLAPGDDSIELEVCVE